LVRELPSNGHENAYGRKEQQAPAYSGAGAAPILTCAAACQAAVKEVRPACAQAPAQSFIFLTLRFVVERDSVLVKKPITINGLAKSILGFSMIFGACAAIGVGVAGGYRSPLSPSADAGLADTTAPDVHTANLLTLPSPSGPQSHY
jgi:hypothetical protein